MAFQHLSIEDEGHIVRCTFANAPRNTFTFTAVREMHHLLNELEDNKQVRVLVLTGASEEFFIRHYEVQELVDGAEANLADGKEAPLKLPEKLHAFNALCLRLENAPFMVVAAINGSAAGGGCEVTLSCDFRLMKDGNFHYGLPETNIGILPGGGGTQRFARMLGTAKALDLIIHGTVLTPGQALDLGLLHRVYPAETFNSDVTAFAENLASRAPIALQSAKQSIRRGVDLPIEEALLHEQQAFDQTMVTQHAAKSMRAYLDAGVLLGDMDYDFAGE
jgi:enoyl-CoA hydratase/carnithine racemase